MFGDVVGANIVGYEGVDANNEMSGAGSVFMPISGEKVDFTTITVSAIGDDMTPGSEYVRVLNPDNTVTTRRLTYVSKDWIDFWYEDAAEEYYDAIGWWEYPLDDIAWNVEADIEAKDFVTHKVKGSIMVAPGTAFLGNLLGTGLRFTSNGEVPNYTTEFKTGANQAPLFMNFMPVEIDLSQIKVSCDPDVSGTDEMTPGSEYIRELRESDGITVARYTYVSKDWIDFWYEDAAEEYYDAIGWWEYPLDDIAWNVEADIEAKDFVTHKVTGEVPLKPGKLFLGNFLGTGLIFNFPDVTNLPK